MENPRIETRAKIRDILRSLTGEERRLLAEVVGAERENLDTSRPGTSMPTFGRPLPKR